MSIQETIKILDEFDGSPVVFTITKSPDYEEGYAVIAVEYDGDHKSTEILCTREQAIGIGKILLKMFGDSHWTD